MPKGITATGLGLLLPTLALVACGPGVEGSARPPALILVNGTLLDGTGAEPVPGASLVIIDGWITDVRRWPISEINDQDEVVDLEGGFVMPGIINSHVHQGLDEDNLRAWIAAGVTTVCEAGTTLDPPGEWASSGIANWNTWAAHLLDSPDDTLEDFIPPPFSRRDNELAQPDLARARAAGPFITADGGYPLGSPINLNIALDDVEDARQKVDLVARAGASYIKIGLENHWGNATWGLLTAAQISAMTEAAHGHGIPVVAHVSAMEQLATLLAADPPIDAAMHMIQDRLDDDALADLVARRIPVVPTLAVWQNLDFCAGYPAEDLCHESENLGRLASAGGAIAYGDDHGNAGITLGLSFEELELMEAAGMTTADIITAATLRSAEVCNVSDILGSLEPGKLADILVLGSDPLADIHNLADVQVVYKNGLVVGAE